jgi:signal transduction histidine kinase
MITTINDNGDGFPPEAALEVFQPFRRLSAKGDGQGLGLAICKRIVERHSGTIRAVSEPAGGTTITVTLRKVGEASS